MQKTPSANCHLTIAGRQVQVTLRGTDELDVLERLEALLARYPQPQAPASTPSSGTPQCPTHGVMKRSTKGKGWYCPQKLADGSWCKEKGR